MIFFAAYISKLTTYLFELVVGGDEIAHCSPTKVDLRQIVPCAQPGLANLQHKLLYSMFLPALLGTIYLGAVVESKCKPESMSDVGQLCRSGNLIVVAETHRLHGVGFNLDAGHDVVNFDPGLL